MLQQQIPLPQREKKHQNLEIVKCSMKLKFLEIQTLEFMNFKKEKKVISF